MTTHVLLKMVLEIASFPSYKVMIFHSFLLTFTKGCFLGKKTYAGSWCLLGSEAPNLSCLTQVYTISMAAISTRNVTLVVHFSSQAFPTSLPSGYQTRRAGKWTIEIGDFPIQISMKLGNFPLPWLMARGYKWWLSSWSPWPHHISHDISRACSMIVPYYLVGGFKPSEKY